MSATNYAICTPCEVRWNEETERAKADVVSQYGRVSRERYAEIVKRADEEFSASETLAEYYELWIDDDMKFHVRYSCHCDKCGFAYEFKTTEDTAKKSKAKATP